MQEESSMSPPSSEQSSQSPSTEQSTFEPLSLCEWVLVCELARGLIEAKIFTFHKVEVLTVLSKLAPDNDARTWAASRLQHCVPHVMLESRLAKPNTKNMMRAVDIQSALIAEFLIGCRYSHMAFLKAIAGNLRDRASARRVFTSLWETLENEQSITDILSSIDLQIPQLCKSQLMNYAVSLSLLRRICYWPLFYVPRKASRHMKEKSASSIPIHTLPFGLSLPLSVRVLHPESSEQKIPETRIIVDDKVSKFPEHQPSPNTTSLFRSLLWSVKAAKATWRSKHGRVVYSYRNVMEDCSVEFNFYPTVRAFQLLKHGYDSFSNVDSSHIAHRKESLQKLFDSVLRGSQRSLEAYLAQGIVAQALERRFGARTAVTGSLLAPEQQRPRPQPSQSPMLPNLNWAVCWPPDAHEEQLVEGILSKALHAGSSGVYERMVIPAHPARVYQRLCNYRSESNKTYYLPHFIPAATLSRLLDVSITGLWRNQRFVRCEHLAANRYLGQNSHQDEQRLLHQAVTNLSERLRKSTKQCVYITTDEPEFVARALAKWFAQLNTSYPQRKKAPTQPGTLIFKAVEHEIGLPFLASLYHAMAGQLDGRALQRLEELGTISKAVEELSAWFNHRYDEAEPWQAPDILVFYDIKHIREHSKKKIFGQETWFDVMGLLLELHQYLGRAADTRCEEDIGATRLILIDTIEAEKSVCDSLAEDWLQIRLPVGTQRLNAAQDISYQTSALDVLRTVAPAAAVVSVQRVIDRFSDSGAETEPFSRLLEDVGRNSVMSFNGVYGLLPEQRDKFYSEFSPNVLWRAHVAAAASYAPWLQLHSLISEVQVVPSASDEWLLPERLSEINYHLNTARHYLPSKERDAISRITRALITITHVQHHTHPARLRLLRRHKSHIDAYIEWQRICEEEKLHFSEHYQVLDIGAFILLEQAHKITPSTELTERIEEILAALHAISKRANALSKLWMGAVEKLIHLYALCFTSKEVSHEFVGELLKNLEKCHQRGMTINDASAAFESIGDFFYSKKDTKLAHTFYQLGVQFCTRHSVFCLVKAGILAGTLQSVPQDLLQRAERRFRRLPSLIPWLSDAIAADLISLLPRTTSLSSDTVTEGSESANTLLK